LKHTKTLLALFMLLCIPVSFLVSEDTFIWDEEAVNYYEAGNQNFTFTGGTKMNLFDYFPHLNETAEDRYETLGWYGSIGWEMFLSSSLAMGVEIGYSSNPIVDGNRLLHVPILYTVSWYPMPDKRFDVPLSLKTGFAYQNYNDWKDQSYFGPMAAFSAETMWRAFDSWSFSIETQYWLHPEIYFGDNRDSTALGNFLSVALKASFTNR